MSDKKKKAREKAVEMLRDRAMNNGLKNEAQQGARFQKANTPRKETVTSPQTKTSPKTNTSPTTTGKSFQSSVRTSQSPSATQKVFDKTARLTATDKYGDSSARGDGRGRSASATATYRDRRGVTLKTDRDVEKYDSDLVKNRANRSGYTARGAVRQTVGGHLASLGTTAQTIETTARSYNKAKAKYESEANYKLRTRDDALRREQDYNNRLGVKEGIDLKNVERRYDLYDPNSLSQKLIRTGDRYIEQGQQDIEKAKEGANGLQRLGVDLGANAIQMAGDRLMAFVPGVGQALAMGSLMNRAGGTASYEARQLGMNPDQQATYQQGTALIEGLSEGIFNSVSAFRSTYGKGAFSLADRVSTSKAAAKIVDRFLKSEGGKAFALNLARLGAQGFEEGVEEVVADLAEPALKYALTHSTDEEGYVKSILTSPFHTEDTVKDSIKTIAYDFLVGALMGAIPGGIEAATGIQSDIQMSKAMADGKIHADEVIARGLAQGRMGENATDAEVLASRLQQQQAENIPIQPIQMRVLEEKIAESSESNARAFERKGQENERQAIEQGTLRPSTGTRAEQTAYERGEIALENKNTETVKETVKEATGKNISENAAMTVGRVVSGTATNDDIDTILTDNETRQAVETVLDRKLSLNNAEARATLEDVITMNEVANKDTLRAEVQKEHAGDIAREVNMSKRGGKLFTENYNEAVDVIGNPSVYEDVFIRLYSDGMIQGSDFNDVYDRVVGSYGGRVADYFTKDVAFKAFNEGRIVMAENKAKSSANIRAKISEGSYGAFVESDAEAYLNEAQRDALDKMAKRGNVTIHIVKSIPILDENGKPKLDSNGKPMSANGYYKNGVITIAADADNKLITVAKHELTHHIKKMSPKRYQELEDFVFKKWYDSDPEKMEDAIREKQLQYQDITVEEAREEIIADASEAFFTDEGAIHEVMSFSEKLGKAIHDGIHALLDSFIGLDRSQRYAEDGEEGYRYQGYGDFLKDLDILRDAERMWLEALESGMHGEETDSKELTDFLEENNLEKMEQPPKLSLKEAQDSQGNKLTEGQKAFFKDSKATDENGHLAVVYHTTDQGGFTVFDPKKSDDKRSLFFASNFDISQTYSYEGQRGAAWPIFTDHEIPTYASAVEKLTRYFSENFVANKIEIYKKYSSDIATELGRRPLNRLRKLMKGIDSGDINQDDYVIDAYISPLKMVNNGSPMFSPSEFVEAIKKLPETKAQSGYYETYLNLKNPLVIDGQGTNWSRVPYRNVVSNPTRDKTIQRMESEASFIIDSVNTEWKYDEEEYSEDPLGLSLKISGKRRNDSGKFEDWSVSKDFDVFDYADNSENSMDTLFEAMSYYWVDDLDLSYDYLDELNNRADQEGNINYIADATNQEAAPDYINEDGYKLDYAEIFDEISEEDGFLWSPYEGVNAGTYSTRDLAEIAEKSGYDGVIIRDIRDIGGASHLRSGASPMSDIYIAFNSEQVKLTSNENPTVDKDIRYSVKDSEGNTLSKGQQEYFGNSKVRNADGSLKVMYHGSPNEFTQFDIKKAKPGLYGRGFYFTEDKSRASQYGKTYGVYLDVETPLQTGTRDLKRPQIKRFINFLANDEDYGIENYGYGATVDSVLKSVWGKDDFAMLQDLNASAVGDFAETVKLFNKVNGTSYDGIIAPTETIAFYPEQIKDVGNKKPSKNPDIRFSLKGSAEETKDLLAVHNLKASDIEGTLELGGFPMPSIAIIKASEGHNAYGEYSAVFDKSTIDPSVTKRNVVYGGDAWTPTFPKMQYKANDRISKKISQLYYDRARELGYDVMRPLQRLANEPNEELDSAGGEAELKEAYKKNVKMMRMFLRMNGKDVQDVINRTEDKMSEYEVSRSQHFIDALGENAIREFEKNPRERIDWVKNHKADIEEAYASYMKKEWNFSDQDVADTLKDTKLVELTKFVRDAMTYLNNGAVTVRETVDSDATNRLVEEKAKAEGYDKWVEDLLTGIEEKKGIRNNKDYFTPSGNRRSWEALHDEPTLLNIVQVMSAQDNGETFLGSSLKAVAQKQYKNISEIKADKGRLRTVSPEEYKALMDGFAERETEIINRIDKASPTYESNPFIRHSDIQSTIVDDVRRGLSKKAFLEDLKKWANTKGATAKDVDDIFALVRDVANIPTGYFEAKPKRPVTFNEVKALLAPSDAPADLISKLKEEGLNVVQYEAGNDEDRIAKLNQAAEETGTKFSLKTTDNNVSAQNTIAKLEQNVADLKAEFKRTDLKTADPKDVRVQAGKLLKRHDSNLAAQKDLENTFNEIFRLYKEEGTEAFDKVYEIAKDAAVNVVNNIGFIHDEGAEEYKAIKDYLKTTEITVDDAMKKNITDYEDFRKKNFGRLKLKNGTQSNIDNVYMELSELFPAQFTDDYINPADQLYHIVDVLDSYKPYYETLDGASPEMQDYVVDIASDIMETAYGLQTKKTFADKKYLEKEAAVKKAREKARESRRKAVGRQRMRDKEKLNLVKEEAQKREIEARAKNDKLSAELWKANERVAAERLRAEMDIQRLKQQQAEAREKRRERREDSEARTKLLKIARRLDRLKTTSANRERIDSLIGELDLVAKGMTEKSLNKLTDLAEWYDDKKANDPDFIADSNIEKKLDRLAKKQIKDMTLEDVRDLYDVLSNIENEIATSKKLIESEIKKEVKEAGRETIANINKSKGINKKLRDLDGFFINGTLSPLRQIRRVTGYVDNDPLYIATKELADGQRKMLDYQMTSWKAFDRFMDDKKFISRLNGKNAEEIEVSGTKDGQTYRVKITPDIRMAMYLASMDNDNLRHMKYGGIKIPDIKLYKKGKIQEALSDGVIVQFTPSQLAEISSHMTKEEKEFAQEAFKYFNVTSPQAINETSEILKGYSIARVDNYYPIHTDTNFLTKEFDTLKFDGTIEGMGFLKERVKASEPIIMTGLIDTLTRSIEMNSKYVGLAIPVRNFGKLFGMKDVAFTEEEQNGELVYKPDYRGSVQDSIVQRWGDSVYNYIAKFMTDIQSGRNNADDWEKTFNKMRSRYAGAVLTMNASVALKQAASYPTAAAVLGRAPLVRAMADVGKVDLDLIAKYTPLQWYRSQGFSTTELGDIKSGSRKTLLESVPALNWIQGMDLMTTRKLWKASEYYVRMKNKNLKVGTDEYYKAVADIYNRVIEETQPNYTTLQRPGLLRSDSSLVQMLNMFKTQPYQNFNIVYDALGNYMAKRSQYRTMKNAATKKALKNATTDLRNAVDSQIMQLAVFAAMTSLWALFRRRDDKYRDEKGNISFDSYLKGLTKDMASNSFAVVPFGSDIYGTVSSAITGEYYYGFTSVTDSSITDFFNSMKDGYTTVGEWIEYAKKDDPEKKPDTDMYKDVEKVAESAGRFLGVPFSNIKNTIDGIYGQVAILKDGEYIGGYEAQKMTLAKDREKLETLFRAYQNDQKAYEELRKMMIDDGISEDKINNFITKKKKENPSDEEKEKYDQSIKTLEKSNIWKGASEDDKDKYGKYLENIALGIENTNTNSITKYAIDGLTNEQVVLFKLALRKVDKPNRNGNLGSFDKNEKEEALKLLMRNYKFTEKQKETLKSIKS